MDVDAVLRRIDRTAALEFLAAMLRFKSYSATPGEADLARHMAAAMGALGLESELMPVEGDRFNAIGTLRGQGGGRSLMFNGHLDTNPATDDWTVDPWGGLYDDDFIWGIGVSNMKSGDAAAFMALKTIVDAGLRLKGDVILEYVVGELQGGVGTVKAIEQGVRADCFINMEPTDLNGLTLHAGAFNYVVELHGITRHVSKREEGVDALRAACELVPVLDEMVFTGAATADHAAVNRSQVGVLRGSLTKDFHDWRPPQLADYARLVGTARYAPSQSEDSVMADLRRQLDRLEARFPGLRTELSKEADGTHPRMLPFEVPHQAPVVQAVARAHRRVTGADLPLGPVKPYCFYGTDAAHLLHRAGMEGIVCGPGGRYNTMPDERVDVADYLNMIRIYLLAILEICEVA
ncbi:MAG: M20/M25/M40 family metallo-hydrolase [Hyphomicrobiales bacterium]|nr:M20/M25/M40 family metallo-hydrolase [Hyphomicrobiales bacterium]MCP5374177.1 M20/M25/M40 family metallo-hydrolase [Hyphomicrobiales bacterium]